MHLWFNNNIVFYLFGHRNYLNKIFENHMKITLQYFEEEMVVRQYYQWVATSAEPSCQTLYSIINWISEENSKNIYIPLCVFDLPWQSEKLIIFIIIGKECWMNILTEELKNHQIERRLFKVLFNLQHISQVNIMLKDCSCNIWCVV